MPISIKFKNQKVGKVSTKSIIIAQTKADFLQRVRDYKFLFALFISVALAYLFVPEDGSTYVTLDLSDGDKGYRGIYNSAWLGGMVAIMAVIYVALIGFFVVRGSVTMDVDTGVGQIIASTSLHKRYYIMGKSISNFLVLCSMMFFLVITVGVMQIIRGEDTQIKPLDIILPFLLIVLPVMAGVAAIAVFSETIPSLRGGFGSIFFFFFFLFFGQIPRAIIEEQMVQGAKDGIPGFEGESSCCLIFNENSQEVLGRPTVDQEAAFAWDGIEWGPETLIPLVMFLIITTGVIILATFKFDRFDSSKKKRRFAGVFNKIDDRSIDDENNAIAEMVDLTSSKELTPLKSSDMNFSFVSLVIAELGLMLKGRQWWFYGISVVLIILPFTSTGFSSNDFLIVAWIWPLLIWSSMGTREIKYRTDEIVYSSPNLLKRQYFASWMGGVIVTMIMGMGVLLQHIFNGRFEALFAMSVAIIFIPSLAMTLGSWSGGSKLTEFTYLMWWYVGPGLGFLYVDYTGSDPQRSIDAGVPFIYLGLTFVLILAGLLGRRNQIRN